jgi:UDP-N-acetylglucosamine 2-epimerase
MLKGIEAILLREKPDYVLVYGDTNSTLAGALAAAKLHMPVAHVEAGLRSFNRRMPEEINRVMADHLSFLLLCPTETAVKNLAQEGITEGVKLVGDVMYDAFLCSIRMAEERSTILKQLRLQSKEYFLATVHRAENTDDAGRLQDIVKTFQEVSTIHPVIWPLHPRTRQALESYNLSCMNDRSLCLIDPISYLDMLVLEKEAKVILTDSGGVQKEACWLRVPCVTLREETEWIETVQLGWNTLAGADPDRIFAASVKQAPLRPPQSPYSDGHSARRIVQALVEK